VDRVLDSDELDRRVRNTVTKTCVANDECRSVCEAG
jgi:hypothetical protein